METRLKTKPPFLEGGLPAASLSTECQRDNNARQRPPQNRLHIWWAPRPPTISRDLTRHRCRQIERVLLQHAHLGRRSGRESPRGHPDTEAANAESRH
ncbi:DUF1156 domain-containing protein, partial [Lamprobacter modestohalophilus]|uniref:DUF1156 domain-containing protein n=1 Tax=Lamprobacter modestohalophilus TaxID=1064514 RepID=UPI003D18E13E